MLTTALASRVRRRHAPAVVATVASVAVLSGLLWAGSFGHRAGEVDAGSPDCSVEAVRSAVEASVIASACGVDVEVTGERTPWLTSWVNADGTRRLEASAMPVRTEVSGEWTEVDTSLQLDVDRAGVEVKAPVYAMEFNAGGRVGRGEPLGVIERDGHRLEVGFPLPLPVPELAGSRAVYELGDGIRLVVSVKEDGTGFLPVIELADPGAADRFIRMLDAVWVGETTASTMEIAFPLTVSDGLRVVQLDGGAVEMRNPVGEVVFDAPPPVMWDSSSKDVPSGPATDLGVATGAEFDRSVSPAEGDRIAPMEVSVTQEAIAVRPDAAMLADPATEWPVYLDPGFSGHGHMSRIALRTGGYTGSLWNFTDAGPGMPGEGAGYCSDTASCNVKFTQRLVWQFGDMAAISAMERADIVSAGFTVNGTHSAYCSATTTELRWTDAINAGSTWSSVGWGGVSGSRTEAQRAGCAAGGTGYRTYDASEAIRLFAENNLATITLGLKAADESTMTSWKRFAWDATLSVTYNRVPSKPSSLQVTNPTKPVCSLSTQAINSKTPTLSAIVSDPDGENVSPHFQVYTKSGTTETEVWNSTTLVGQASGTRAAATVAAGKLAEGTAYFWRATSVDTGGKWSGWGGSCKFSVDVTPPTPPTVTPVTSGTGVDAVYVDNVERGGIGMKGKFTLGPAGAKDIVKYSYSFGDPAAMTTVTVDPEKTYELAFNPTVANAVTLYVKRTDLAGNVSPMTEYRIKVATPVEDVIWKLDENTGTSAGNSGPKSAGLLSIIGAGWIAGPHQLFGSRDDDWALTFDGVNDAAISQGPVLDTSKSFTVSAHVLLNTSMLGQGDFTALSQDGLTQSGFQLGYRANCTGTGKDCWSFGMPETSAGSTVAATSSGQVTAGEWVQLVGEHDATAKTVRLWVCEVGTPDRLATGEPVASAAVTRGGAAWQSPGAFAVGRGQVAGAGANWWPGRIDNVRVFSGQITDASKLRRLCQGAEAEDFGQGVAAFDAVDPTKAEQ